MQKNKNSAQLQINIRKSVMLLYTSNKETKKEIKKQLHPKKLKPLVINLTTEAKGKKRGIKQIQRRREQIYGTQR